MTGIKTGDDERYLLTGATGFLGSHIMAELLTKGKGVVIIGRSSGGESLKERIRKLLLWFGIDQLKESLEIYEADFQKTRLGLSDDDYENLCSQSSSIIHCASDTSFSEKNRERVMKSNVECLTEILNFAIKSRAPFFHFISSAYAAGNDRTECPEAPANFVSFTNVYEESKALAEDIVSKRCRECKIPFTIIRPSIVYGDSLTGRSLKFNALYYAVRSLKYIRDIYLNDIKKNGGKKSAECGIYIDDEGRLNLPIRLFIPNDGNINLIPVNYFTEAVLSIMEKPVSETIYHITSNNPERIVRLASYTERFLNIRGISVVIGTLNPDGMRNPPEELFDFFIRVYRPYMSDRRIFMRENTNIVTDWSSPPDFSYEIFQKCMAFAVLADWGQKLFC